MTSKLYCLELMPCSKRAKLDEQSGNQIFLPDATSFKEVVGMPAFIDHSGLIKKILAEPRKKCIVAPSRFCKSMNMEMVRSFCEIEVDNEGNTIRNVTHAANNFEELKGSGLKNYDLFCKPVPQFDILNNKNKNFVLKHFGRYPVIKLEFSVELIASYKDAFAHCRHAIHMAYKQHEYLRRSKKLDRNNEEGNAQAQKLCEEWCGNITYMGKNEDVVITGLMELTEYLHSHFGRKVFLLVDEFDAVVEKAKFCVERDDELQKIVNLLMDTLGFDLKGTHAGNYVEYVLLTGISSIVGIGASSRLARVVKYMFLETEDFVGFYGALEDQVVTLVTNLKRNNLLPLFENKSVENIMEEIIYNYNGYYSKEKGTCIFSLWCVLHYLQSGKAIIHWTRPHVMTYIGGLLKEPAISAKFLQLIAKPPGEESVLVKFSGLVTVSQLRGLVGKNKPDNKCADVNLFLAYLKELGYLSYVRKESQSENLRMENKESTGELVRLANEEIRRELQYALVDQVKVAGFDFTLMNLVANKFFQLFQCDICKEPKKHLKEFHSSLETLFQKGFQSFKVFDINESVLTSVMIIAFSNVGFERMSSDIRIKDNKESVSHQAELISGSKIVKPNVSSYVK